MRRPPGLRLVSIYGGPPPEKIGQQISTFWPHFPLFYAVRSNRAALYWAAGTMFQCPKGERRCPPNLSKPF